MDYKGQALAERLYQYIIAIFTIVGFIAGFIVQRFIVTAIFSFAGLVVAGVICLPEWPFLNRDPLPWQKCVCALESATENNTDSDNNNNNNQTTINNNETNDNNNANGRRRRKAN
eukprot:TRINITY_DN1350_c3_g1_i1.p1 TRINITY_DN1350_c3_g1~~TRINITY_DN1350_c3_g1_i1.p1  ORF type:complete len:122 (-),score=25.56 TRINITY_DN1350_c3_g1_i1:305-649(-)